MKRANIEQREFHSADGVEVVSISVPEADKNNTVIIEQHQHDISHITLVASGSTLPVVDGVWLPRLTAGQAMTVEAFKTHCFWFDEPTQLLCITNTLAQIVPADEPRVLPKEFKLEV